MPQKVILFSTNSFFNLQNTNNTGYEKFVHKNINQSYMYSQMIPTRLVSDKVATNGTSSQTKKSVWAAGFYFYFFCFFANRNKGERFRLNSTLSAVGANDCSEAMKKIVQLPNEIA